MAARDSNAMSNLQYRLLGGEQVLPLIGAEQTTSSLVVMIFDIGVLLVFKMVWLVIKRVSGWIFSFDIEVKIY